MRTWKVVLASLLLTGTVHGQETPAALEICDGCSTDGHFANRALLIPPPYTTVFVSNRDEIRKFSRLFSHEDFVNGGSRLEVEVIPETVNAVEQSALEGLIEKSDRTQVTVPRDRIDFPRNSVVGDLQNGNLDAAFLQDLRRYLQEENFSGDPNDVELGVDIQVGFLSINMTQKDVVRTRTLVVKVDYPDGSSVRLTIGPKVVQWLDVSIKDALGNEIPVEDFESVSSPINTGLIEGRELVFNPANPQFIENFLDALRSRNNPPGTLDCETELTADGIRLRCTSTP